MYLGREEALTVVRTSLLNVRPVSLLSQSGSAVCIVMWPLRTPPAPLDHKLPLPAEWRMLVRFYQHGSLTTLPISRVNFSTV